MECFWNDERLVLDGNILSEFPAELIEVLRHGSNCQYLETIGVLALDPRWTSSIYCSHKPLFVDICNRWIFNIGDLFDPLDVASALSRILPFAPQLSIYVEELVYKRRSDIFDLLMSKKAMSLSELPDVEIMRLMIVITRLVEFDNQKFASMVLPAQMQVLFHHSRLCIRYLAIKALCSFLHAADATSLQMVRKYIGNNEIEGPWEGRTIDFNFFLLWEEKRLKELESNLLKRHTEQVRPNTSSPTSRVIFDEDLCKLTISFAGVLVPNIERGHPVDTSFVLTTTTKRNLRAIAEAISGFRPVVVTGASGYGKSTAIRYIAKRLGKADSMLTLHLNEQTDAKLLIGMYTSANTPGSFRWEPGVLTTAVMEGRWVFIEDLDRAPAEVVGTLLPLLDRRELVVPNLGGPIHASRGFKLIATIRSSLNIRGEEVIYGTGMLGFRHWDLVPLAMLSDQDLNDIIHARFSILHAYQLRIMKLYSSLRAVYHGHFTNVTNRLSGRPTGPQDLMRYCSRLQSLLTNNGVNSGSESVSEAVLDSMFMEAVDCFAGSIQSQVSKAHVCVQIARELHVAPERAQYCIRARVPATLDRHGILTIGRATLHKQQDANVARTSELKSSRRPFATTNHALRQLESIGVAVSMGEPCLLVGETGTGKTTIVQKLASLLGRKLVVVNLSQQSEAGDLLGGYKPVNARRIAMPLEEEFEDLFEKTFSANKNQRYIKLLGRTIAKGDWIRTLALWQEAVRMADSLHSPPTLDTASGPKEKPKKRRKIESSHVQELRARWDGFSSHIKMFQQHVANGSRGFSFSFVEGNIVKAVRNGDWVLLDEINLASPDTLESLADLLSDKLDGVPSILLSESGDIERVKAHPEFRIFGAMNPATDVGKRDLPNSLRSRFTEYSIESPDGDMESLQQIIGAYLGSYLHTDLQVCQDVAQLYLEIRKLGEQNRLVDGADQKPHYSLRTLTRTLTYVSDIAPLYGLRRALYEGFSMSFLTLLDKGSETLVRPLIERHLLGSQRNRNALLHQVPRRPEDSRQYVQFRHYWVAQGFFPIEEQPQYIITPFIESNLLNLVRATSTRRFPVLLQGPTSSGKTSMLEYLAKLSGNRFVRINNHEHTDLQEYMGTYVSDPEGHLQYQEGILVRALREGHWIVLDELNLAPTDVLEALNRLLDDNRELLIPETQQIVRPHENFMLFATQNPPGLYGGRKLLSRAFRNRFLELHFDDIPEDELETILRERTQIAPSFCSRIVNVYKKLAVLRQSGRLFEQKNSFATLRDLFRWALRDADDREQLAINGFMLLAERVRKPEERLVVKEVIEEVMKVKIDEEQIYSRERTAMLGTSEVNLRRPEVDIVWTRSMRRLYVLITQALKSNEPVLLVGPTGCGKTSIAQAIAKLMYNQLHILNAHQNTETGDIIGAQRPVRNRSSTESQLLPDLSKVVQNNSMDLRSASMDLDEYLAAYDKLTQDVKEQIPKDLRKRIEHNISKYKQLFEWADGSLVVAMKAGQQFLLDEISLADDSVLERLNSVLEPDRTLLLAEKGPYEALVKASNGFQFLATMNPGGDYGKKELSPALRNRFTEIWVPPLSNSDDILQIVNAKLDPPLKEFAKPMVEYSAWHNATYDAMTSSVSLRQVLTWVDFVNISVCSDPYSSLLHGVALAYIDGIGANPSATLSMAQESIHVERQSCLDMMSMLFKYDFRSVYDENPVLAHTENAVKLGKFELERLQKGSLQENFDLEAPTTLNNALRVVRALQLRKPLLLEGSPGVGKTSLIIALARAIGMPLTRINLSEQTDIMDLFGSDVPVEGAAVGNFTWRDAPFLQAMQRGEWVLLDEMNLASQSVLEGLNACLDHRGQVYVPELDKTFNRHPRFALFAAQNPHRQGGGRKGLPASFVNRFSVVYADLFTPTDLTTICTKVYPNVSIETAENLVRYVTNLGILTHRFQGPAFNGGPWEFNLRDILRWLYLLDPPKTCVLVGEAADYTDLLFLHRLRTRADVTTVSNRLSLPRQTISSNSSRFRNLTPRSYQCGIGLLLRNGRYQPQISSWLDQDIGILESLVLCVQHNWPCLLVGLSGCGKSSTIRYLAGLTGADIVELPLNSDTDTMDLLGGYEQVNLQRSCTEFFQHLKKFVQELLIDGVVSQVDLTTVQALLGSLTVASPNLKDVLQTLRTHQGSSSDPMYMHFLERGALLLEQSSSESRARFEWVDGVLIKALQQGQWLVLDNANLCSSSVLDRLNALLEPNGVLVVNEYRGPDGSVKVILPHKDFRLFLTADPRYGDLSRAMRNRCIELYLHPNTLGSDVVGRKFFCDSTTSRFRMIGHFDWSSYDTTTVKALASVCIDHFAFQDFGLIKSWWTQVGKGLIHISSANSDLFSLSLDVYMGLASQQSPTLTHIFTMYQNFCTNQYNKEEFCLAQTIHPLNNVPLLPLIHRRSPTPGPVYLACLFETLVDLEALRQELSAIESSSQNKPASQLSRIERSMASSRVLAFSKDSTQPLAEFLQQSLVAISMWVEKDAEQCSENKVRLTVVNGLRDYIRDVLDTTRSLNFDEGVFQSHLAIGRSLLTEALQCQGAHNLGMRIQQLLDRFRVSWDLGTGTSMDILWQIFRPPTARNFHELGVVLKVEELADRLDGICWQFQGEIDTLAKWRLSFLDVNLFKETDGSVYAETLTQIEKAVCAIEEKSDRADTQFHPYFKDEFEGLRQYFTPKAKDTDVLKRYTLDLVACRASRHVIRLGDNSAAQELLSRVRDYTGVGIVNLSLVTLRNTLPISMLSKLSNITEVPLRALDLLEQELRLLTDYTAHACNDMAQDQFSVLNIYLGQLHTEFLEAHSMFLDKWSIDACKEYVSEIQLLKTYQTTAPKIQLANGTIGSAFPKQLPEILESYIHPSLKQLEATTVTSIQLAATAVAWVSFFTGCLLLYIPDRPFDPALKPMVECERHKKRSNELKAKLNALESYEGLFTGQRTSLRCELVKQKLQALGIRPQVPAVVRPAVTELPQLQGEFTNILNSIVRKCPGREGIQSAIQAKKTSVHELQLLRKNIEQVIHRLSVTFRAYDDVTKPLIGLLCGLDVGLALALMASSRPADAQRKMELVHRQTPFLGLQPRYSDCMQAFDHAAAYGTDSLLSILELGAVGTSIYGHISPESQGCLLRVFQTCYENWKQKLREDRKEESAKTSLYRYRGGQDENESPSDEELESVFPNYDKLPEVIRGLESGEPIVSQAVAQQVAEYHRFIFTKRQDPAAMILTMLESATGDLVRLWKNKSNTSVFSIAPKSMLPALIVTLYTRSKTLLSPSSSASTYNFYLDANLVEARDLVKFVKQLQIRFKTIQKSWPEHATLNDVLRTSKELLAFKHDEPLAKLITNCEQLHSFVHEWQVVASNEYSAIALYDELTAKLVGWRRLELSTWPHLLDMEYKRCMVDAKGWWFIAYEAIIAASVSTAEINGNLERHTEGLLATLEEFFRQTSIGQFPERLRLIEAFKDHLNLLTREWPSLRVVCSAVVNFLRVYTRFEPSIEVAHRNGRKELEKAMKEITLLASWKDTNILALRESAKRSHHKLFKVIRKYRMLLAQPVDHIINQGIPEPPLLQEQPQEPVGRPQLAVDRNTLKICKENFQDWDSRPTRYTDPEKTVTLMKRLCRGTSATFDQSLFLESFSTNLVDTIQILQKETPSILTPENKDTVKHLKSRKRKMFADTLKEIRGMGFSSNPGAEILSRQASLSIVLASSAALENRTFSKAIETAEHYHHKSLENIVAIRELAREHSDDLTSGEVARSIGHLESIIFVSLRQRELLANSLAELEIYEALYDRLRNLWAPNGYTIKLPGTFEHQSSGHSIEKCVMWLPSIIDVSITIIKQHSELGNINSSIAVDSLGQWRHSVAGLASQFKSLPRLPPGLSTTLHAEVMEDASTALECLTLELKSMKSRTPSISFVLDQIMPWTNSDAEADIRNGSANGTYLITMTEIQTQICTIIDMILVGTQRMQEVLAVVPASHEEKAWLLRADSLRSKTVKAFHLDQVCGQLDHAMSQIQHIGRTAPGELGTAAALFATSLPTVHEYGNLYKETIQNYFEFHIALCRMASVLTTSFRKIVAQGFCAPSENSAAQEGNTEKLEGGTGLGEGEGAEDISKDVQDDEDLSELAQQGSTKKDEAEMEDEEDAIDLQHGELEGELVEDVDDNGEDRSDAGSEGSNDDMDDQAGEVDDLDPSAVDEKLWEGSAEDNKKKKEGDQSKGKKQNDMAAQELSKDMEEDEAVEGNEAEGDGAEEAEGITREEIEKVDPHLHDGQTLELPEEMNLDDENDPTSDPDGDEEMDDMSDVSKDSTSEAVEDNDEHMEEAADHPEVDTEVTQDFREGSADVDKTEEASSPIDTEPEDEEEEKENLLQHQSDDAITDAKDAAPSEGEGLGAEIEPQSDATGRNEGAAQDDEVHEGNPAKREGPQTEASNGETGQLAAIGISTENQQTPRPSSSETEAFKKLGDALEQWHRQSRRIQQAAADKQSDEATSNKPSGDEQDFEHLPNEDAEADAQALGAVNDDQTNALDKRALDAEVEELPKNFLPDEAATDDPFDECEATQNDDQHMTGREDDEKQVKAGAMIGINKGPRDLSETKGLVEEVDEDDIEDLDKDLSTTHLATIDQRLMRSPEEARTLWSHYENLTRELAVALTEQLRLILAPTLATKMRGDFRTGKRLNMKRIIPYIASQYKRDKIWMRRSIPSKRNYQILLALDDSKSMGESGSGQLAFETLALVSKSLSMLEVGQICIVGFGEEVHVVHEFDQTFSSEAGGQVFRQFGFQQTKTNVRKLIADSIELFREARSKSSNAGMDLWQLELIVSDGVCEDHEGIRRLVRQAHEERIMIVFIIVDSLKGESIIDMTQAIFEPDAEGEMKLRIKRYLEGFPFGYYLIVGDVRELPGVLAVALRQWFAEVTESA